MIAPSLLLGLDVGSTTVKAVVLDQDGTLLFSRYTRHYSEVYATVLALLRIVDEAYPGVSLKIGAAGSGAITLAGKLGLAFIQEVLASGLAIRTLLPQTDVSIELGGEDAKLTFFRGGVDQRMNETCAGGTGAFIDQMAAFIQTDAAGLDGLAARHTTIYPIASRCGVFAKTDILPLLNEGSSREDIAASIMQSVVNQTVSGLARGRSIEGTVVFLGGPLTFLPSLRQRFAETLGLAPDRAVLPEHSEFFVAIGAALSLRDAAETRTLAGVIAALADSAGNEVKDVLPALFADAESRAAFVPATAGGMSSVSPWSRPRATPGSAWTAAPPPSRPCLSTTRGAFCTPHTAPAREIPWARPWTS